MREDLSPTKDIVDSVDAEVKRISDLFRFVLKYKEQFQASGIEFSDLREYMVTDDASRIDWKNSAKSPDLYVKEYEEEKDMDTFILLDVSDSMLFGTTDKLKSEYAAVMSAALAYASVDAGINVGIGLYAGDDLILTPDGGQVQYQKILREVTHGKNYGGDFNLETALNDVIGQIKPNTALFIISDFIDVSGDWQTKVKLASTKFRHVMCVMIRDLRDYKLPDSGNFRLESPDGEDAMVVNTSRIRDRYNREAKKQEEQVKNNLRGSGASFLKVDTRDNFSAKFAEYFDQNMGDW
jgi:uncharacterized protein (DUF58 family)